MKTNKYSREGYYHVPIKVDRYLIISSVKKIFDYYWRYRTLGHPDRGHSEPKST